MSDDPNFDMGSAGLSERQNVLRDIRSRMDPIDRPSPTVVLPEGPGLLGPPAIPSSSEAGVIVPPRQYSADQMRGNPEEAGVIRRATDEEMGLGGQPEEALAQQPRGMQVIGTRTVGRRRPRPEMYESQFRTRDRYDALGQGLGRSAGAVGDLSNQQAEAAEAGQREIQNMRARNEERRGQIRRGIERSHQRYQSAIERVEQMEELDPGRAWARRDTGSRVMASIAVGLQGLARMFGKPIEEGAIQRLQDLVRQDLDIQKLEYERAGEVAGLRRDLYATMRERFRDENSAMEMAEAGAWRLIQNRAEGYSRQIQNEQARNQIATVAAEAGAKADEAQQRGLAARAQEMRRSRGRRMITVSLPTANGPVQLQMTPAQYQERMLEQYDAEAEANLEQRTADDRKSFDSAITAFHRPGGGMAPADSAIAAQTEFRNLVRAAVEESGGDTSDFDLPGFNPMRSLVGDEGRRGAVFSAMEGGAGDRLRALVNKAMYEWIKAESGAHFTDAEFLRRRNIVAGELQTPQQLMFGLQQLGRASLGGLRTMRAGSPRAYRQVVRNSGLGYDPIEAGEYSSAQMERELFGDLGSPTGGYDRNSIMRLYDASPQSQRALSRNPGGIRVPGYGTWAELGRRQEDPDWVRRQSARDPRNERFDEDIDELAEDETGAVYRSED